MADIRKVTKFVYNPESLGDICEFNIVFDHLHWKLLCKQSVDMNTTASHLLAMIVETYLVKTGYLDPKAPSTEGYPVAVTIRELRDHPDNLFNFRKNTALVGNEEKEEALPGGLGALDSDDELDFS